MNKDFQILIRSKLVSYSAKDVIYSPCGSCRELIRMVDTKNLETEIMVSENKVCKLKELLPEMFITKQQKKLERIEGTWKIYGNNKKKRII